MSTPRPVPPPTLADVSTLAELLAWRVARTPRADAYLQYEATSGRWRPVSWKAVGKQVEQVRLALPRGARMALATSLHLDPDAPQSLQAPVARAAALERIRSLTRSFPYHAQPRAVALTQEPWTTENTLLTPTLKLKRKNMKARFAALMDSLYR